MEKLAYNLSLKISKELQLDDEKTSVMAYGLSAFFQMLIIFVCITVVGVVLNTWMESIIIFWCVGVMRSATGGHHATKYNTCLLVSICSIVLLSSLARYIPIKEPQVVYILAVGVLIFSLIIAYKNVPVSSVNKPINNPNKIKRLRNKTFVLLVLYCFAAIVLGAFSLYSFAFSFMLSSLWQIMMLTRVGEIFIGFLDRLFKKEVCIDEK